MKSKNIRMDISPETFSTLPPEEQDKIIREYIKDFSTDDLLAVKHLIEQINRPAVAER